MKKILSLAVLLLTLLPVVEVAAQSYGNESYGSNTSCTSQSTGIWCKAQASNADIYTEVYDEDIYDFNDFSEYGDFSQEVVFSDGTRYLYGLDEYNGNNMTSSTLNYGRSNTPKLSEIKTKGVMIHDLIVLSNGNKKSTLNQVVSFMSSRSNNTGHEVAAIRLKDGNFVVYKDAGNKEATAAMQYTVRNDGGYYKNIKIVDFYHTHPYLSGEEGNPLDISEADIDVANDLQRNRIYIIGPDGTLYYAYSDNLAIVY